MIIIDNVFVPSRRHSKGIVVNANDETPDGRKITDEKLLKEFVSTKQTGGVGYSPNLDTENWAKEISASGKIAVMREQHGEIWT